MAQLGKHPWTVRDDLVALYLHRFGTRHLGRTLGEIADERGIPLASLRMRMGNFKALDGSGGLSRWAQQSQKIHTRYGNLAEPDLRAVAFPSR
jgi:hypothetical protein